MWDLLHLIKETTCATVIIEDDDEDDEEDVFTEDEEKDGFGMVLEVVVGVETIF
jgi:hypothetical protein